MLVTSDLDQARADLVAKLSGESFGDAGRRVVIEEGLTGRELSVMAICDGWRAVALAPAQDFKRAGDGDTGPNTGGMGAFTPVPGVSEQVVAEVMDRAVLPTLAELRRRGIDFRGVLYAGLMLTDTGCKVLEFNVRFGDPETQVVTARWQGDVAAVLAAAAAGRLDEAAPPVFSSDSAVCVVLAAPGYPEAPATGTANRGLRAGGQARGDRAPRRRRLCRLAPAASWLPPAGGSWPWGPPHPPFPPPEIGPTRPSPQCPGPASCSGPISHPRPRRPSAPPPPPRLAPPPETAEVST